MQRASRLKRELQLLATEPPPGITCWQNGNHINDLRAHSIEYISTSVLASAAHILKLERYRIYFNIIGWKYLVIPGPKILGCTNTPYEKGVFALEVIVPERYPFEPPKIRFLTPIYHPNIDSAGRICLDVLRLPPKGAWRPSLNIATLLTSIQILMNEPNPDDPLMADISSEYKYNKQAFLKNARQWTEKYASQTTMPLEITNEENYKSQAELPKDSSISQKRKGSNISGLSKKCRLET